MTPRSCSYMEFFKKWLHGGRLTVHGGRLTDEFIMLEEHMHVLWAEMSDLEREVVYWY